MTDTDTSNIENLLDNAWKQRKNFHSDESTNCYRMFHGYEEGFQGISIDRYGDCAIINKKVEFDIPDPKLRDMLLNLHPFKTIVMKVHQKVAEAPSKRVRFLHGHSTDPLKVLEHGHAYHADHLALHTNGLYLDARPVRRWLKDHSAGRRILNLFAHTGSLGIAARLGDAKEVIHLDKNKNAIEKIRLNYQYNNLPPDDRGFLHGDLYFHLPKAIKSRQKFSGIILDPPPIVPPPPKAPKHRPVGQDFNSLIEICCDLLDEDAWLMCIYHSAKITHDQQDADIIDASKGRLAPYWRSTSDEDFPESNPDLKTRMTAFRFSSHKNRGS